MSLVSRLLTGWFAFLLPAYSTFKALKQRPLDEREVERWASYWTVIGAVVAFEYAAEWLLSWFPFYWEIKTIFLLFLSLPQTEGSTYIYQTYVEPFLIQNEAEIDASITSARTETITFLQTRLTTLWELVWSAVDRTPMASKHGAAGEGIANGFPPVGQKALQSLQGLLGALGSSAHPPAEATAGGRPVGSRTVSGASAAASNHPPSPRPQVTPAASGYDVGYDVGEAVNN
ncbi:TB2/DP1, HVA22 family-domain-containing protein [Gloeopeniophorella convolvens]|nr:TB2/DP1, HVA22 family-domain-containing protein [Gloeopeniophorella convolvens]